MLDGTQGLKALRVVLESNGRRLLRALGLEKSQRKDVRRAEAFAALCRAEPTDPRAAGPGKGLGNT